MNRMMVACFLALNLIPVSGFSQTLDKTLELTAKFVVSADSEEINSAAASKAGWVETTDDMGETAFVLTRSIGVSDLPVRVDLGPAELTINKKGEVEFGMSIGDADAGSTTTFQLPLKRGKLTEMPKVEISNSAGDYASGAWQFHGKVGLEVVP